METNTNPLIEYFYSFGISPETVKKPEYYKENNFLKPEFLKAEVLNKFPPVKKPNSEIDPNVIINHCFPNGFKLVESTNTPKDEFFHFCLDNTPSRHTKNKYIYYTCLLFYESLITYYNIQKLMYLDTQNSNMANNISTSNKDDSKQKLKKYKLETKSNTSININKSYLFENFYIPKVICFCSFIPFPNEFKFLLKKIKDYSSGIYGKISIPLEKIIENIVITIPRPIRGRFNLRIKKDHFLLNGEKNDFEIAQCDFNQYNFHSYRYQLIFTFSIDNIVEIYKSLLLEIPLVFFSKYKEKLTNIVHTFLELLSPFRYQFPTVAILPDDNLGIIEHSKTFVLGINNEWIDQENGENFFTKKNILIFNKAIRICDIDNQNLDLYFHKKDEESVVSFEDLGKKNDNLENSTTANNNTDKSINNNIDESSPNTAYTITNENSNNLTGYQLPYHYCEKLKKKLNAFYKEKINYNDYDPKTNKKIGEEIFYYFLVSILQNYNMFLYNTEKEVESINKEIFTKSVYNISIEKLIKIENFLYENRSQERDFFIIFMNTKLFRNFLERKYLNRENDKYLFLHFDETILRKKNKKFFNKKLGIEFLTDKSLQTNSWYVLNKNNNPNNFNKSELSILKEKKKNLIYYYQIFGDKDYKYYLFPILLYDNIFFNNEQYKVINYFTFNNTNLKSCLSESNDVLNLIQNNKIFSLYNTETLVQFKNNPVKNLYPNEIENSIYLLWLKVFCMTFYYCDKNEKYLRFYEMIKIVRSLYYVKDNILSLILATLEKYGDEYMTIQFFEYLKDFTYGDYAYLANKLLNTKRGKGKNNSIKKMPISNTGLILNYYKDNKEQQFSIPLFDDAENPLSKNLKKRTFFKDGYINNNENNGTEEIMRIDNTLSCNYCAKKLDIAKLTISFEQMDKYEKLKCYYCKKMIEPKVRIRLGDNNLTIILNGPYFLYSNICSNLMNNYGNELDLDELREKHFNFLYNCCWYFRIKGISYDMMLKYKQENNNINNNATKKKRKTKFVALEIEKTNE